MGEGKYSSPREALKSQQSFIEEYSLVLFMNFYGLFNCNMLKYLYYLSNLSIPS